MLKKIALKFSILAMIFTLTATDLTRRHGFVFGAAAARRR
jgi:hypothetical protein